MSKKATCHGCDGKGWVQIILHERMTPFMDRDSRTVVEGKWAINREMGVQTCPLCKGSGVKSASEEGEHGK